MKEPRHKRYLTEKSVDARAVLRAAEDYVAKRSEDQNQWLLRKPYAPHDHRVFFREMYNVLNLMQAMKVGGRGKFLEVGCGPGWVTEMLCMLGYDVTAVEPCADMVVIAKKRLSGAKTHYGLPTELKADFLIQTLEDGLALEEGYFDAVLFHAALHHIVDERRGLAECFRVLRPGGVLGITEWAWSPGSASLEAQLDEEMRCFGTLENPFTQEYLDYLLTEIGFERIERFDSINGFFTAGESKKTVGELAQEPLAKTNNLTAFRPSSHNCVTTADRASRESTLGEIHVRSVVRVSSNKVDIRVVLKNKGASVWNCRGFGRIRLSLYTGEWGSERFSELNRFDIPREVLPGEEIAVAIVAHANFEERRNYWLHLLAEGNYWLSFPEDGCKREITF